jgi:hypothetical protein
MYVCTTRQDNIFGLLKVFCQKVNDHVLQVVFILFLGTYSTILGGFGEGIKNLNKEN